MKQPKRGNRYRAIAPRTYQPAHAFLIEVAVANVYGARCYPEKINGTKKPVAISISIVSRKSSFGICIFLSIDVSDIDCNRFSPLELPGLCFACMALNFKPPDTDWLYARAPAMAAIIKRKSTSDITYCLFNYSAPFSRGCLTYPAYKIYPWAYLEEHS